MSGLDAMLEQAAREDPCDSRQFAEWIEANKARRELGEKVQETIARVMRDNIGKQCPKCGKFVTIQVTWLRNRDPGVYCEACPWSSQLPLKIPKLCNIQSNMQPSLLELLRAVPENPLVRTHVHSLATYPVPDKFKTFEQIKHWFEYTCEQLVQITDDDLRRQTLAPGPAVYVTASREVNGRCNFYSAQRWSGMLSIDRDLILSSLRNAFDVGYRWNSGNDILRYIVSPAADTARQIEIDMETVEESHDDYEEEHVGNTACTLRDPRVAREAVMAWTYENDPALYRGLNGEA
jgi:hypothetical protein